jgi:hypothetical protein
LQKTIKSCRLDQSVVHQLPTNNQHLALIDDFLGTVGPEKQNGSGRGGYIAV